MLPFLTRCFLTSTFKLFVENSKREGGEGCCLEDRVGGGGVIRSVSMNGWGGGVNRMDQAVQILLQSASQPIAGKIKSYLIFPRWQVSQFSVNNKADHRENHEYLNWKMSIILSETEEGEYKPFIKVQRRKRKIVYNQKEEDKEETSKLGWNKGWGLLLGHRLLTVMFRRKNW